MAKYKTRNVNGIRNKNYWSSLKESRVLRFLSYAAITASMTVIETALASGDPTAAMVAGMKPGTDAIVAMYAGVIGLGVVGGYWYGKGDLMERSKYAVGGGIAAACVMKGAITYGGWGA